MWIKVLKDEILSILMTLMTRSDSTSPEASKLNRIFILEKTREGVHNFKLNVQRDSRDWIEEVDFENFAHLLYSSFHHIHQVLEWRKYVNILIKITFINTIMLKIKITTMLKVNLCVSHEAALVLRVFLVRRWERRVGGECQNLQIIVGLNASNEHGLDRLIMEVRGASRGWMSAPSNYICWIVYMGILDIWVSIYMSIGWYTFK